MSGLRSRPQPGFRQEFFQAPGTPGDPNPCIKRIDVALGHDPLAPFLWKQTDIGEHAADGSGFTNSLALGDTGGSAFVIPLVIPDLPRRPVVQFRVEFRPLITEIDESIFALPSAS